MLSEKLKKRFAKDMNLSITIFDEPYFTERLALYGMENLYSQFEKTVAEKFSGNEEAYLAYYGQVKDAAIDYIKQPGGTWDHLNKADMNNLTFNSVPVSTKTNHPDRDIYKENLVGRWFISIDMRKANFSSLVAYGREYGVPFMEELAGDGQDYVRFMKKFTDNELIIASKYIRQVIFGNCNPKRQVNYEKCLMLYLLNALKTNELITEEEIFSVHNDEIILAGEDFKDNLPRLRKMFDFLDVFSIENFPLKAEFFQLGRIRGSKAYIKRIQSTNDFGGDADAFEVKCVSPDEMPFIYKTLKGLDFTENDYVFKYEHKLARFIGDEPKLVISYEVAAKTEPEPESEED